MIPLLMFLLYLAVYALIAYVVIWLILTVVGLFITLPAKVAQILYLIAGIVILIWAVQHLPFAIP